MGGIKIMKYYNKNNEVFAFESDGSQDDYITKDMVMMTDLEVDKHLNPKKYMSDEQLYDIYVKSLKPLTRRQFKLVLLENNLLEQVETLINSVEDTTQRTRLQIEYSEATEFQRTSNSVKYMCNLLGLTEEQVNQMWEQGLTL
jgi:predicted secreted protein